MKAKTVIGLMIKKIWHSYLHTGCSRLEFIFAIFEFQALVRTKFMLHPLGEMCNEKSNYNCTMHHNVICNGNSIVKLQAD